MRKAVIEMETGEVVNVIVAGDDYTMEGFYVVTLPDGVSIGWRYAPNTGEFIPPPAPEPVYMTADEAKAALRVMIDDFTAGVTGAVPVDEKASWTAKEQAARAYIAGSASASQTLLLSSEAHVTGEDIAALANKIIQNADAYLAIVGYVAGLRRAAEQRIDAASSPADYDVILADASNALNGIPS